MKQQCYMWINYHTTLSRLGLEFKISHPPKMLYEILGGGAFPLMTSSYLPGLFFRLPIYLGLSTLGVGIYAKPRVDEQNKENLSRVVQPIIISKYGTPQPFQLYPIPSSKCQTTPLEELSGYSQQAVSIQVGNTTMGDFCLESKMNESPTPVDELSFYNYKLSPLPKK